MDFARQYLANRASGDATRRATGRRVDSRGLTVGFGGASNECVQDAVERDRRERVKAEKANQGGGSILGCEKENRGHSNIKFVEEGDVDKTGKTYGRLSTRPYRDKWRGDFK
jgi:hypothetical protein